MKKCIALVIALYIVIFSSHVSANIISIDGNGKKVEWKKEYIVNPVHGQVKVYSLPVGYVVREMYGFWEDNEWVIHDGQKEVARSIDEFVNFYSPKYLSYNIKTDSGKKFVF